MNKQPWHKRYHSDALTGYQALDLEERGAYTTLLDLMYDRGEALEITDRLLAGYLNVSVRKATALLARLVTKGKIARLEDGRITNSRFEKERENALKKARECAENGSEGGRVSAEIRKSGNNINGGNQASLEGGSSYIRSQKPELEGVSIDTPKGAPTQGELPIQGKAVLLDMDTAKAAVETFNAMAAAVGLPKVQHLTDKRRKALAHRLQECGGLDGWEAAMQRIGASDFLTGRKTDWRCDFDFILQASSFTKIMEGSYDNKQSAQPKPGGYSAQDAVRELRARLGGD